VLYRMTGGLRMIRKPMASERTTAEVTT